MSTASINVVSGINGAGKTLFLLQLIEKLRKETGRPVYYWGIPGVEQCGVLTDWKLIEEFEDRWPNSKLSKPASVHDIENGAIIVIDEAHKSYGRSNAREVPGHIEPFAMSRHKGHTFYLCTQNVADLHQFIRERVGKHFHLFRVFGLERSTLYEWEGYGDHKSTKSLALAIKKEFSFPKEVYTWYKSSDAHTIQKRIPWGKIWPIPVLLVLAVALAWYAMHRVKQVPGASSKEEAQAVPAVAPAQPVRPSSPMLRVREEGPEWAARMVPRVQGVPQSAQFYDAAYKAAAVPRLSGCSHIKLDDRETCTCHTQQGSTIVGITYVQCLAYVKNGWFDPMKPDAREREQLRETTAEVPQPLAMPAAPSS